MPNPNDKCPCGSGKMYKDCCGKQQQIGLQGGGSRSWILPLSRHSRSDCRAAALISGSVSLVLTSCITQDLNLKVEDIKMQLIKVIPSLILGGIATVAVGAFVPGSAMAQEHAGVSRLLNKANAINYEEIEMAKLASDKAGDNQALLTFAKTCKGDHQANEDAVTALSRAKNVKIEGTPASIDEHEKQMENLSGGAFNEAFLTEAVQGHAKALQFFESEKGKFRSDPDVYLYVEETIPVVRAHLEMARAMKAATRQQQPGKSREQQAREPIASLLPAESRASCWRPALPGRCARPRLFWIARRVARPWRPH